MSVNTYVDVAKRLIESSEVISFDIFDTLLLRPYLSPKDLFLHIEKEHNLEGFFKARILAEKKARKANLYVDDITIDHIYENISSKFKEIKQIELDWEYKVLHQNPEFKLIWDYAQNKNKKIIVISDMYLPSSFLEKLLKKNGFEKYEKLYVSSEYGETKKTGKLFKIAISELNINANKIVHFGDNKVGDYKKPKEIGIKCLLYPQVNKQFLNDNKREEIFSNKHQGNLGNSILISLFAWRWQKKNLGLMVDNYWENMGYKYAAPLTYSYARWIECTSKLLGINHILFVARDGYLLKKNFDSFNGNIKTTYIYAPRIINLICRLDYDSENEEQVETIFNFFLNKYQEIQSLDGFDTLKTIQDKHNFIQENYKTFEKYANTEFINYRNYIDKIVEPDSIVAVVDTKTIAFTSQKLLEHTISKKIIGFYWSTILSSKIIDFKFLEFLPNNFPHYDSNIFSKNWKLMEVFFSSPEYPIKGIDQWGEVIYEDKPSVDEVQLKKNFKDIDKGVDTFLQEIQKIFGTSNLFIDAYMLVDWVNILCDYPKNEDIQYLSEIRQASDVSHLSYKAVFASKITFGEFVNNPKSTIDKIKNSPWRTLSQSILLNIVKPIKAKRQNKKTFRIAIFPYLQRKYLVFWLRFFSNIQFEFIVGKFKKD